MEGLACTLTYKGQESEYKLLHAKKVIKSPKDFSVVRIKDYEFHRGSQTRHITFKMEFFQLPIVVNH